MENKLKEMRPTTTNVSPFFLLFLTFLVLKLTKVIVWSWWWVTAPLWGLFAIGAGFIVIGLVLGAIGLTLGYFLDKKGK